MDETIAQDVDRLPLDDLHGLTQVLQHYWSELAAGQASRVVAGRLFCPRCNGSRAMRVTLRSASGLTEGRSVVLPGSPPSEFAPALVSLSCVQCSAPFVAVIYETDGGPALAVLPHRYSTPATPHTPPSVAFYLDQAMRSQSAGATSAAVAMFRLALESLLAEEGYLTGSLGLRLHQLAKGVESGSAPKWALELEPEFFAVLRKMSESSISLPDGDVRKQLSQDDDLLPLLDETFRMLLFLAYEVPHEKNERLAALRVKAQLLQR
mgnify:CR=1 FL=1